MSAETPNTCDEASTESADDGAEGSNMIKSEDGGLVKVGDKKRRV